MHPLQLYRGEGRRAAPALLPMPRVWLTDSEGNRVLDGMAGLWNVIWATR